MIKGSMVALITPFSEEGDIDWVSFRRLVSWQIEEGSQGLVISGTTGESATLSSSEQEELVKEAVKEARGRIPIFAGTGSNDTRKAKERTLRAKEAGADGALVVFPYYNKPTFEGCLQHFMQLDQVGLPLILYHHPGRTGLKLSALELADLAGLPQVVGLKEASGDVDLAVEFMRLSSKALFSGDDSLTLPLIGAGAQGCISVIGNLLPKEWSQFIHEALYGNREKARLLYSSMAPLCKSLFLEPNPQGIKYAMSLYGHCQSFFRLPLLNPKEKTKREIENACKAVLHSPLKSS